MAALDPHCQLLLRRYIYVYIYIYSYQTVILLLYYVIIYVLNPESRRSMTPLQRIVGI